MNHPLHNVTSRPPAWMRIAELDWADMLRRTNEPWSVSRWGDGEWYALLKYPGRNSDRQPYHPELGESLRRILVDHPPYLLGMRFPDQPELVRDVPLWLQDQGLTDLQWTDAALAFHNLSIEGQLPLILDALRLRPLVFVGPPHLRPLGKWLPWKAFVEAPLVDAWRAVDGLERQVAQELQRLGGNATVAVCAGITAKPLVDRLWRAFPGQHYLWDLGAIFDPYVGVYSRRYHRNPEFRATARRVLEETPL